MSVLQDHHWLAEVATTGDASDVTALKAELDEAREQVRIINVLDQAVIESLKAEVARLRAALQSAISEWERAAGALAVFANELNWESCVPDAIWAGERCDPWTIAQEAVQPHQPGEEP